MENVSERSDQVIVNGQARHVSGYLRDFLFRPEQLRTPASALSGGERNRLLLARLFASPANVLVLDEPTNDLDIETLELLEELVCDFAGTLLLVSHDRAFLIGWSPVCWSSPAMARSANLSAATAIGWWIATDAWRRQRPRRARQPQRGAQCA